MSAQPDFVDEQDADGTLQPAETEAKKTAHCWPTVGEADAQTALAWALRYVSVGWFVFPLDLRGGRSKKPVIRWGEGATQDPVEVRRLWLRFPGAPIGIACKPSRLVCVDIDNKNGKNGGAAFAKLMGGNYGTRLVAKTPSGGEHYIYKADPTFEVRSRNNNLATGIDTKAGGGRFGGYFVATNGLDDRRWLNGPPDKVAPYEMPRHLRLVLVARESATPKNGKGASRNLCQEMRHAPDLVDRPRVTRSVQPGAVDVDLIFLVWDALKVIPADDRDVWRDMIFAVHAVCGGSQDGIRLVRDWSNTAERVDVRDPDEAERIFRSATLPTDGKPTITAERLWATARLCGFQTDEVVPSLAAVQLAADRYRHSLGIDVDARIQELVVQAFGDQLPPLPDPLSRSRQPFPLEALPPSCRAMVEHGARAQGIDTAFWAVPMLGILAGCIGNARRVQVKSGWEEPALLWTAIVAPSGTGKSPPLRELLLPVRQRDHELHRRTLTAQALYAHNLEALKSTPGSGPKPTPPPMLAVLVDDATLEALIVRLQDNPRGLLLANDELAGFLRSFDKYRGGGGDEQRWLSIHNADPVKVDRKSSPGGNPARIYIPHAAVSIVGTIQPGIAAKYLGAEEQRSSGLSARLLVAAPPSTAAKWTDKTIPPPVVGDWGRVVGSLLDLPHDIGEPGPNCLALNAGARAAFIEFHDENGAACLLAAKSGDPDLAAALAKLRGAAPRIALVLALAKAAEDGMARTLVMIDEDSMRAGIKLAKWFEIEARGLYRGWSEATKGQWGPSLADRILAMLQAGPKSRDELRDAFHRNVASDAIGRALDSLLKAGLVVMTREPTGGRPRELWSITL